MAFISVYSDLLAINTGRDARVWNWKTGDLLLVRTSDITPLLLMFITAFRSTSGIISWKFYIAMFVYSTTDIVP